MAIKFVDEADLTTVGNAIRAKTGGSDLLTFPEGMAEAIAGILAGGANEIDHGTFTVASDISTVTLEHQLSGNPQFFVCVPNGYSNSILSAATMWGVIYDSLTGSAKGILVYNNENSQLKTSYYAPSNYITFPSSNTIKMHVISGAVGSYSVYFRSTVEYMWFAGRIA